MSQHFRGRASTCDTLQVTTERPDLLLLDEPTNHLDADSVAWLERHLGDYRVRSLPSLTIVISDNVANGFLNLTEEGYPFAATTPWLEQKEARLKIEEKQSVARQKTIARELEWVRSSPKARQSKSKARIAAYDRMVSEQFEEQISEFEMQIPPGAHLGDLVIEAKNISKGFGDKILMEDLSFSLPAGGIVGVIGPNGAGKTTLFRMLTEQDTPDSGELPLALPWKWAMSIKTETIWILPPQSMKKFPVAMNISTWEAVGSIPVGMSPDSISKARIRKRKWVHFPAVNVTVFI